VEINRMHEAWRASAYRRSYPANDPYYCEWGAVIGDRVRRLRRERGMTLLELGAATRKPEDRSQWSPAFLSRLERGRANAPLYVYLQLADVLGVDAGVLLGSDAALLEATEAERMLLRCLRSLGIPPHEAMTALVKRLDPRDADQQLATLDNGGLGSGRAAPVVHE
jgi:transcriptional regulator with XRE-family HTH domain